MKDRCVDNIECLSLLIKTLKNNPDLRIEQLLFILDESKDYFNEEPNITLNRWKNKLKKYDRTS